MTFGARATAAELRVAAPAFALCLSLLLTAGGASDSGGPATLRWSVFKEPGGAFAEAAKVCSEQSGGRYRVELPTCPPAPTSSASSWSAATAARDKDIDILGMDVIWTAELADARWILPSSASEFPVRVRRGTNPFHRTIPLIDLHRRKTVRSATT